MDQSPDQQDHKEENAKMTASDCKDLIVRLQKRYKFLRQGESNFDAWDHYDASSVLADLIAFLRNYDED